MTKNKITWLMVASLVLLLGSELMADRRLGVRVSTKRVTVGVGHHHGHYRSHYLAPVRRTTVVRVARVNFGSVDFNVRPQQAEIFVDGRYLGIADHFNGYPQTAKLPAGYHHIRVVSPSGAEVTRRIYVAAGKELNFNLKF